MNYLASNINNSMILPGDIIRLIYEYADPLYAIREQLDNKSYYLKKNRCKNWLSLWEERNFSICGLNPIYKKEWRLYYLQDLEYQIQKHEINYRKYSTKQLYKKWLKL